MKKLFFSAAGLLAFLCSYAQPVVTTIDSTYKSRKLKFEEVNLVSSYYSQDGNNAAVTGGLGSQKLSDIANVIDIQYSKYDKKYRKHTFTGELGVDHYTSASSDKVDLKANSSASHGDTRIYPSISWSRENEEKGQTIGAGVAFSQEYDYSSSGLNASFAQKTKNKNGEFTAKVQAFFDNVKLIAPVELRAGYSSGREDKNYGSACRNTFAGSLSYSQIINKKLQVLFLADVVQQQGYLSLPFHRVYFNDLSVHQENVPGTRLKIPLGVRANYFLGDKVIVRTYYRYYTDDWGVKSNTASIEVPVKITPFLSISPFYRYYDQTAADFFAPYAVHTAQDKFYNSNYDLSKFSSSFMGAGLRVAPPSGVFCNKHLAMLELRYGHYTKSVDLNADIISLNIKFK